MSDTNKVVEMLEKRANLYAEQKKSDLSKFILNNLEGCNYHQCYSHILRHIEKDDCKVEHVDMFFKAMLKACKEKHYKSQYENEVKNISQMLSFMQNELEQSE